MQMQVRSPKEQVAVAKFVLFRGGKLKVVTESNLHIKYTISEKSYTNLRGPNYLPHLVYFLLCFSADTVSMRFMCTGLIEHFSYLYVLYP
jgi:hypothetical protein